MNTFFLSCCHSDETVTISELLRNINKFYNKIVYFLRNFLSVAS